ncbi:uncharacterized protein P884DRAFT_268377 [Thermothelomyces heterothallicus CBS 202.75]|uniref:uncharacterized protein n=1 Tax=Thermothelomyces heterothallicus CBS 202.75 TaxID=1149848 RepID=UPI003743FFB5
MIGPLALRLIASGPAAVLLVPGGGQRTGDWGEAVGTPHNAAQLAQDAAVSATSSLKSCYSKAGPFNRWNGLFEGEPNMTIDNRLLLCPTTPQRERSGTGIRDT